MALEFKLPDIGEGIAEGEITTWLVKEGDVVEEDQPMVEVMTDKATVEITSPRKGTILSLLVEEGTTVDIGSKIVVIGESGEAAPKKEAAPAAAEKEKASGPAPGTKTETPASRPSGEPSFGAMAGPRPGGKALAAPSVRRMAREQGIDIDGIAGSGPAGRVLAEDLEGGGRPAAKAPAKRPAPVRQGPSGGEERFKLKGLRRKISERLSESQQKAVHVTHVDEVDVSRLMAVKEKAATRAESDGVKLTYLPLIIKALIATLREFPMFNATLDEESGEIVYRYDYHIGVAVASDRGLLVPVVRNADRLSLFEIAAEVAEKATATRDASIGSDDLQGSTITITNYGAIGGLFATPIINFPEAAILGVGGIKERPVVVDGQIVIRPMMYVGITFDHRITDGAEGAHFMNTLKSYLEEPALLLLET